MQKGQKPIDVDSYIAGAPKETRSRLREIRAVIRKTAPDAIEKISYRMPYYGYKGRLAYFAAYKNHIGLYIPPPVIEEYAGELNGYKTAKGTVQFPHQKPLPLVLIRKLIKTRLKLNEEGKGKFAESDGKNPTEKPTVCSRGHKFYKSSDCPVCPICWSGYYRMRAQSDIPAKLSAPALRALVGAKIKNLKGLARYTEAEIAELHGIGPNAMKALRSALKAKGLAFKR